MTKKYIIFKILSLLLLYFTVSILHAQQWQLVGSVSNPGVRPSISIASFDFNSVWIVDGAVDTPKVFRSIDGGYNWTVINPPANSTELYCLWAFSNNNVIVGEGVVSGNARLLRTSDAGISWITIAQTQPNQGFFNGIAFPRGLTSFFNGLAVAERIYRSTDFGNSWTMLQSGVNGVSNAQNSLMIIDNLFYGFGLNNGAARIRLTTNNAGNWVNQQVNISGSYTCAIAYKDDKLMGLAATSSSLPTIGRTTDGGNTWNSINIDTGATGTCKIKWVLGTSVVYIMGENGGIKRSLNNGITWSSMTTANVTGLTHFDFLLWNNIIYGYAVSRNGSVIKLIDSVLFLTGLDKNKSKAPSNYKLEQNYPNPFNPSTTINYQLPSGSFTNITVYDILGREVAVLVNENKPAGYYQVQWDGSNYSSGVYIYKMTARQNGSTSNEYIETKKFILMK